MVPGWLKVLNKKKAAHWLSSLSGTIVGEYAQITTPKSWTLHSQSLSYLIINIGIGLTIFLNLNKTIFCEGIVVINS